MREFKTIKKFKDIIVLKYLNEINFDDEDSLYIVLVKHLINGDLDEEYTNEYLDKYNKYERLSILKECREYSHLFLLYNDPTKYDESVNSHVNDKDFILLKLLENYDFLIRLYLINEDILDELSKYENNIDVNRYSVIEVIRSDFSNDEILIECLDRIVNEKKYYDLINIKNRSVLYSYPIGILYTKDNNKYNSRSLLDIGTGIYNYIAKDDIRVDEIRDNPLLVNQISKFLNGDLFDFKETIIKLSDDYYKKLTNI